MKEAEELKKQSAERDAAREADRLKKEQEELAALAAMTPEQKEERDRQMWLRMIEKSPYAFADFLKNDPSLSRSIPAN